MLRMIKKSFALFLLFSILVCAFSSPLSASAEEMVNGYPQRWVVKSGSLYWTKVNSDNLNSNSIYRPYVSTAINNWDNAPTKAYCTSAIFSESNVDIGSVSSSWWNNTIRDPNIEAITVLYDTYGSRVLFQSEFANSNGNIDYACIYVNPSENQSDTVKRLQTIVHEIGHVYGMGHTSTTNSIMYPATSHVTNLTSYDDNVMNSFYK